MLLLGGPKRSFVSEFCKVFVWGVLKRFQKDGSESTKY